MKWSKGRRNRNPFFSFCLCIVSRFAAPMPTIKENEHKSSNTVKASAEKRKKR